MILDLEATCWALLRTALTAHQRWCRDNAISVPADLTTLLKHAKCVSDRQRPTEMPAGGAGAHDAFMSAPLVVLFAEAAHRLGVSKRTVERLAADGSLPTVDVGGAARVRVADLEAYVASLSPRRSSFRDAVSSKESA